MTSCQGIALDTMIVENTSIVHNTVTNAPGGCVIAQGGGIAIDGNLTTVNSVISYNRASSGEHSASGGGISASSCQNRNYSKLIDTEVNYNVVESSGVHSVGGVDSSHHPIYAERSMISGNRVEGDSSSSIGGIFGPVHLTNTVVSHNYTEAGSVGGINAHFQPSTVVNSTIHDNSGYGFFLNTSQGEVSFKNSIIAYNGDDNCYVALTNVQSQGYNLSDDDTCRLTATGDMSNTNPLLAVATVDGVEQTTHALTPQSPAIDGANAHTCPAVDVHGTERPQAGDCDIGAYEYAPRSLLRFTRPRYSVPPGTTAVTLTVERSGDSVGEVTVAYATEDMTALAGADYTEATGLLTFAAGEATQELTVALLEGDAGQERTFMVTLSAPTGGALLAASDQAAVTIEANAGTIYLPSLAR